MHQRIGYAKKEPADPNSVFNQAPLAAFLFIPGLIKPGDPSSISAGAAEDVRIVNFSECTRCAMVCRLN